VVPPPARLTGDFPLRRYLAPLLLVLFAGVVGLAPADPPAPQRKAERSTRKYGWKRDLPGVSDPQFLAAPRTVASLPSSADLRPKMPAVYDQEQLGSCTAQAIAGAVHYEELASGAAAPVAPSRLMIYYLERLVEGTVESDAGAVISDGIKMVGGYGYADEKLWPYDISKFREDPPRAAYDDAKQRVVKGSAAVPQQPGQIKAAIAAGHPVVFGFTVYESFESDAVAQSGVVPMPKRGEWVLGGHAVLAVGYDDAKSVYVVRNSWGPAWGQGGYCTMPYAYLHSSQLASDFWVVSTAAPPAPPTPPPPPAGPNRITLDFGTAPVPPFTVIRP
jgi:C1A family cysteine protease